MANFANAISYFQSGEMSRNEFFAQVDRALAAEQDNAARLLEVLDQENAKKQLPPDVYIEVQRRIESTVGGRYDGGGEETRLQTQPGDRFIPPTPPTSPTHPTNGQLNDAPERMKGVGDTLNGRFILEECIGFGGMGTVYKALDLRKLEASDRKPYIAIKVLNVQFRGHPKSLIALQREARKAQALAHPNIVSVYDFDRDGSMVYLTMEYLSGKPLSQVLRAPDFKGLPFVDVMHIVNGMGRALAYAHERGFVHCDFKPANVILTDKGNVKVIDFGIARVFQKPEEEADATVFDPGTLGALTPAYASPEMLEHREPDPRDDIYALACITYELLTGRHPFDRVSATQARASAIAPLRPKTLGRQQWKALKAALSFERETRTPTVARFLQEMNGERRRAVSLALISTSVVAGVLIVGGLFYYWQFGRNQNGEPAPSAPLPPASTPAEEGAQTTVPQGAVPAVPATPTAPAVQQPVPALTAASLAPALASVPCSALYPSIDNHAVRVQGYLPKSFGSARLKEILSQIPGVNSVNLDVQQVGESECDAIKLFAPYWVANHQSGSATSIHSKKSNTDLTEGDPLVVDITTPGYDSYVNVDYYALDGSVVHMLPSVRARDNQAPPNYKATIGSLGNWVVSKPFGTEMIVLLITPVPLFDKLRPESESKADYTHAVEKQLDQMAKKYGPEKISVDFVQITTKARKP